MFYRKLGVVYLATILASCGHAEPKYTRAECIVKVEIKWNSSIKYSERDEVIASMSTVFGKMFFDAYQSRPPSVAYRGNSRESIYFQYANMCDKKYIITEKAFTKIGAEFTDLANWLVSSEVVQPSPETINVFGSSWIDGGRTHEFTDKKIQIEFSEKGKL